MAETLRDEDASSQTTLTSSAQRFSTWFISGYNFLTSLSEARSACGHRVVSGFHGDGTFGRGGAGMVPSWSQGGNMKNASKEMGCILMPGASCCCVRAFSKIPTCYQS